MFPFFHVFVPLSLITLWGTRNQNFTKNIFAVWAAVSVGALLPDIIDKPLSMLFPESYSGRGIMHAPLIVAVVIGAAFILLKHEKPIATAFSVGLISHLLLDLPNIPFFWPITPMEIYHSDIEGWILNLITNPIYIASEIVGLAGITLIFLSGIRKEKEKWEVKITVAAKITEADMNWTLQQTNNMKPLTEGKWKGLIKEIKNNSKPIYPPPSPKGKNMKRFNKL